MTKSWDDLPGFGFGHRLSPHGLNIPPLGRAYSQLVASAAGIYSLPQALVYAVMSQESNFRPTAFRAEPKIQDGSYGLMQLLFRTAKALGYQGEPGEAAKLSGLFDPATNIALGCKLLAQNLRLAGSIEGAVSAYNGGFRPHLGFGRVAAERINVCLARDQASGDCLTWHEVAPGEFSNKSYVAAVISRMEVYSGEFGPNAA